ncbi:hypothetical protein [Halobacteriovorax sp. ZH1_bin.1]|uniref:hypothetical protein n=1 Tax=Halobacteriovorax sp. ZH1_bin.1 TaxID=3157723 RepID=UPI0037136105
MSIQEISKKCADSLRSFTKENYDIKLKAAHAHELVAAYFGYKSKNSMLADARLPISRLEDADIIVMIDDVEINNRRDDLQSISDLLPDSYKLGEPFYTALFSDLTLYKSEFPPFRSFKGFTQFYIENSKRWNSIFKHIEDIKLDHIVEVDSQKDFVKISVIHTSKNSRNEYLDLGETILTLERVAGRIGYKEPRMDIIQKHGKARRLMKLSKTSK